MKISYIQNINYQNSTETRISYNLINKFKEKGIEILLNECDNSCDYILSINGLSQYDIFNNIVKHYPSIKSIMYVWDMYPWTPYASGYNNLKNYDEIWVPSNEVILRLKEIYDVDINKCKVIKGYAEFFEDTNNLCLNDNFIYHPVRSYPDANKGFTEKACMELEYNFKVPNHSLNYEQYQQTVLQCSFLVTEYNEASTGGLTLLEGYYHGKNILLSDSIYQGGKDYFGDRAYYFKDGDFEDFKEKIQMLWNIKDKVVDLKDRKEFCKQYIIDAMVTRIINNLI